MRKLFAILMALALSVFPVALAETAEMPAEVQAFYDALTGKVVGADAGIAAGEIVHAADYETYCNTIPSGLIPVSISHSYYDEYYTWQYGDVCKVTVGCLGGVPAAYIVDGTMIDYASARPEVLEPVLALGEAYQEVYTGEREYIYGDDMLNEASSIKRAGGLLGDVMTLQEGDVQSSAFVFEMGFDFFSLQLRPCAAYEGLELSLEDYHKLSAMSLLQGGKNIAEAMLEMD